MDYIALPFCLVATIGMLTMMAITILVAHLIHARWLDFAEAIANSCGDRRELAAGRRQTASARTARRLDLSPHATQNAALLNHLVVPDRRRLGVTVRW